MYEQFQNDCEHYEVPKHSCAGESIQHQNGNVSGFTNAVTFNYKRCTAINNINIVFCLL